MATPERKLTGRAARRLAPRTAHSQWRAPAGRDPVALLEEQSEHRVPELVPIRYERMGASAFAYFRGAAYPMAADLATTPVSGLEVQLCGDAHLSNFGGFAAPDRRLIFDLNDFDETLPGPFEWDVKRLAASLEVGGRANGLGAGERLGIAKASVRAYRVTMRALAKTRDLDVWYSRVEAEEVEALRSARPKDGLRAFSKLTEIVDGEPRLINDPPLVVPARELGVDEAMVREMVGGLLDQYRSTLRGELQVLMDRYTFRDLAHKIVGVGSVGNRAWIVLNTGRDEEDPLFLQVKEATRSVLEPFTRKSEYENQGRRVVEGQRLMQATGDVLLGWIHATGIDGRERDFYVRQLWDGKASVDVEELDDEGLLIYGELCGRVLAHAHARSGDRIAIASYLGKSDRFDGAIAEFASAYADQNDADYRLFRKTLG